MSYSSFSWQNPNKAPKYKETLSTCKYQGTCSIKPSRPHLQTPFDARVSLTYAELVCLVLD